MSELLSAAAEVGPGVAALAISLRIRWDVQRLDQRVEALSEG